MGGWHIQVATTCQIHRCVHYVILKYPYSGCAIEIHSRKFYICIIHEVVDAYATFEAERCYISLLNFNSMLCMHEPGHT